MTGASCLVHDERRAAVQVAHDGGARCRDWGVSGDMGAWRLGAPPSANVEARLPSRARCVWCPDSSAPAERERG